MYENYYGLTEKPFSLLPDPGYLYLSRHHQKALTLLEYSILNQAGFCVISGQAGSGKTTLIRYLLNRFDNDTTVGLLSNTHESFEELLAWILMSFGLAYQNKSKTQRYQLFVDFLIEEYAQKRHTLLIIDEAQNMSPAALEELRMLSNINADKDHLLQMILMGQPGLLKNLQHPQLRQFAQRIAVDYKLEAMNKAETCAYIRHRLKVAGAAADIFNNSACMAVYYHSRGLPRLINLLCDTALVYGYAESVPIIDKNIINDVVKERDENTILPCYRDLNEETTLAEKKAEAQTGIVENESRLVGKMTSCGETMPRDESFSGPKLITSSVDKAKSNGARVLAVDTTSISSLKQANCFSKAMNLQRDSENSCQSKKSQPEAGNSNRAELNVIPVDDKIHAACTNEAVAGKLNTGKKPGRAEAAVSLQGTGRLGFIILGFAFGLLMSVAVLILYKMDNIASPVAAESEIAGRMKEIENNFARKLQIIQQQREADLEKNRIMAREKESSLARSAALQRERDAALAIAKARAELLQAKLEAERALQNQRLAVEKASLEFERARAARFKAKLSQQRKMEALSSVSGVRLEAEQVPAEPARSATIKAIAKSSAIDESTARSEPTNSSTPAWQKQSTTDKKVAGFLSNPCEGPTAVLLSTCKK